MASRFYNSTAIAAVWALATTGACAASFNVPGGSLEAALDAYSHQSGVQLVIPNDQLKGIRSTGVRGDLPASDALSRILSGTGFVAQRDSSGLVGIVRDQRSENEVVPIRLAQAAPARAAVETVTVTSSKLGGADVQSIPIAITALSQEQLTASQTAGGPDLIKQVPNLTFTKTNFTGYSINIRGIGTQAISVTTDPAVAVAFNDTPFIRNHFFEQEFYDVAQVEVLRGPQGTLYGRNATAGVVNVTSARPTDHFEAMASADVGNYKSRRFEGMLNLPIVGDTLDLRVAGEWTKRDGYSFNEVTNAPIDGRDLWSGRVSLRWKPASNVTTDLIWEHFSEDDDRLRSGKQLCARSTLPAEIGGVAVPDTISDEGFLTQGCKAASLYSPASFQTPNSLSLAYYGGLSGSFGTGIVFPLNYVPNNFDVYASSTQSRDLRVIASNLNPDYKAKNDTLELNTQWNVTPSLTFYSDTGYNRDFLWSTEDYNRFATRPETFGYMPPSQGGEWFFMVHPDGNYLCADSSYSPGGNHCTGPSSAFPTASFCDPQLGCATSLEAEDLSEEHAWQFSQELRMASDFKGPLNFSAGGNYMHYETEENYYVFINSLTMYSSTTLTNSKFFPTGNPPAAWTPGNPLTQLQNVYDRSNPDPFGVNSPTGGCCGWIDPNPIGQLDNAGHNYFLSQNPYTLNSYAAFGEVYYDITKDLKLTGGLRWTDDQKHFVDIPSELLTAGYGYPITGDINQEWQEFTGRVVASWTPKLNFTDQSMFYASYAHGYKAGGANPPGAVLLTYQTGDIGNPTHPQTFKPEFNDAFELGTKNTAFDGSLTFNGDVFYYDYKGYQISQIVDRTAINLNFDATVRGAEMQASWEPVPGLKFGFAGGYEATRIANGSQAIDLMDRTAGNPNWVVVKPFVTQASNCILPTYVVAEQIILDGGHAFPNAGLPTFCGVAYNLGNDPLTKEPYTTDPTGLTTVGGSPIPPGSYPGFDPRAGTAGDPYTGQNTYNGMDYGPAPNNGAGFYKNLSGKELPNAPHYTVSLTADYTTPISPSWAATLHGDFYWQAQSWARVFNDDPYDRLHGYTTVNAALILSNENGWQVMGYVKNVFNTTAITGDFLNSDDTALTTNVFLTDPRLFGVRVTKQFTGGDNGTDSLFSVGEGKRPQVWIQVGGDFTMLADDWQHYNPSFASLVPSGFPSPFAAQKAPSTSFDWDGQISIQPEDSDWVLKAGIRYGRSGASGKAHKELPASFTQVEHVPPSNVICRLLHFCTNNVHFTSNQIVDAQAISSERHTIMDFTLGKDVGIGTFGSSGTSTISAGVREAQFDTRATANPEVVPAWEPGSSSAAGFPVPNLTENVYDGTTAEYRSFHGIGPQLTWESKQPVLGLPADGEVTLDWGVNAAVLFGQQRVDLNQTLTERHIIEGGNAGDDSQSLTQQNIPRSRRVTVPNLGGYIGASVQYSNSKISLGYRADTFFNAMDGGQKTAKDYNRGFYGPYLNVSLGL